jgi:hypothetical protein
MHGHGQHFDIPFIVDAAWSLARAGLRQDGKEQLHPPKLINGQCCLNVPSVLYNYYNVNIPLLCLYNDFAYMNNTMSRSSATFCCYLITFDSCNAVT